MKSPGIPGWFVRRRAQQLGAVDFLNMLTRPELLELTDRYLLAHRERLYPPTVTLSMFMKQVLAADRSCQRAVNAWAAQGSAEGLVVQSIRTGAYCQARQRLLLEMVRALTRETGRLLSSKARYPQPGSQAAGVGFPLARLVAISCLSTGAVLEAALGPHAGKGHSELDLMRGQWLGERDYAVRWSKPLARPKWMTPQQYRAFPDGLSVRKVKVDGRVLVTTLYDARRVSKGELSALYARRWQVELDIRNIKTTLGMEVLRCQIPEMVKKELWCWPPTSFAC